MNISYTNPQLREFERDIQPWKEGKYHALNVDKYLIHKNIGIMRGEYFSIYETQLSQYNEVMDKLQQLSYLQNRTTAAKKHEAEERESMV